MSVSMSRALLFAIALTCSGVSAAAGASDVDQRRADGSTELMWAVYENDLTTAQALVADGADVELANDYNVTALQLAAEAGNAPMIKLLLKAGAVADRGNAEGQTPLMLVARTGNVQAARMLLKAGADVNAVEQWGAQTALMWAAARRHPAMVKLLIKSGAGIDAHSAIREYPRRVTAEGRSKDLNSGGLTPLLFAARENCLDCVKVLIDAGADLNLADPERVTPLLLAIMNVNWDVARALIEAGADVDAWDIYGQAPLYAAIDVRRQRVSPRASADQVNATDGLSIVRMLLERGANPNMPLFMAPPMRYGRSDLMPLISRGTTPLIRAAANADLESMSLLIEHGAEVNLAQADKHTPLMAVLIPGNSLPAGRLFDLKSEQQAIEALRLLHAAGADPDVIALPHPVQRSRGGSALHFAVKAGWPLAVEELLSYGADVNALDPDGLSALDYAMARGYVPFLEQRGEPRIELADLLRNAGATIELSQTPDWPPVGPPLGIAPVIWPL
ncbi:MAG: ankyrin repeat domain-containing protein [Gammaproteobacteria bacterium]|nr:ankyrin repeat domain-containing protein [Gammaproteobacteria bacterium]